MAVKKIRVTNFKSFKELDLELGNLNILIGANASGKSNFAQIFKFLRDIEDSGLNNAVSMQGDFEHLRNISARSSGPLSLEVVSDREFWLPVIAGEDIVKIEVYEAIYKIAIGSEDLGPGFGIVEDRLTYKCNFSRLGRAGEEIKKVERYGPGEIILSNVNGKASISSLTKPKELAVTEGDVLASSHELPPRFPLLESAVRFFFIAPRPSEKIFRDISIYDFDPRLPRKFAPITGKAELDEDGGNLAIVLKNIMESEDERRKLLNLVTYLLPFVEDLDVERAADKSFLFKLRETYSEGFLPAPLVSDGTINMIALIIALYFEKNPLAIIEEPERNIHPHLISKVVRMMEDASHNKQIIVTTHNPEMVKHADPKDILLVSRDRDGFSSVSRLSEISDKEKIRIFLENEIGLEELYVDNLLGI